MSVFGTPVFQPSTGHSGTSVATPAFATAAGDLVVVAVGFSNDGGSSTVTSVTDTAGNSYTACTVSPKAHLGDRIQFFYSIGATANASNIITANFSQSQTFCSIAAWDVPLSGAASFDAHSQGSDPGNNTTTSFSTATFNTAGTDEILFAAMVNGFATAVISAGTGWTSDSTGYPSANKFSGAEHRTFTSTQTGIAATFTENTGTDGAIAMVAFKAGAGGAAPQPVVVIMQ
ncbi:MAG: hypothetical protein ACREJM_06050 [Candidatus Saccharimonadales bacterium]